MKYKLNNLYVLIFLHGVCFYFAFYSSILVGAVGLSQCYASPVQCRGFRKSGGWGGDQAIFEISKRGLRNFQDPGGGDEDLWGVGKLSGSRGDGLCRTMTSSRGFRPPMTLWECGLTC